VRTDAQSARVAGMRWILCGVGWLSVALGLIGAFVPLLPTTPFLLLASWCFSRSSPRFDRWIRDHRLLGPFLNYRRTGLTRRAKTVAMISVGTMLLLSALLVATPILQLMLAAIAAGLMVAISRVPNARPAHP